MPTIAEQAAQQRHNGLPTHCAYCREIIAGRAAVGESDDVARADVIAPTASTTFGALAIGAAFRFPPSPATYRKASPYVGTLIAANDDSRAYERTGIDAAHIVEPV